MHDIHLFVPHFDVEASLAEIRTCLEKGWTGLGFKTVEFETAWSEYTGLPHAHFVHSATSGLHLAVKILKDRGGWQDGDEIITTPFTFVSTNHAIVYENLKPVFADIDTHLCLDPIAVERLIGPRTRAVMFVGIGGNTGQWPRHRGAVPPARPLPHPRFRPSGGHHAGRARAGPRRRDATVFSFHAVKNLGTADGGMVCFADAADDVRARRLSWLGIDKDTFQRTLDGGNYKWRYEVNEIGYKYHGNSIMAALGLVQLRRLGGGQCPSPADQRRL